MSISVSPATHASIHPATNLGPATLIVAEAERSMRFYRDFLGFQVLDQTATQITLGVGNTPVLKLDIVPGARRKPRFSTGLYHVAILLPTRLHLAYVLKHLLETRYPFGAGDHHVSEALYLDDPDGNGLEIYRDRPREGWQWQGDRVHMGTWQLDVESILSELEHATEAWNGIPAGTRVGHVHLQVADLPTAKAFYVDVLGFDIVAELENSALFISAGGYHHHIGMNTWQSAGAPLPPPNSAGLRQFVVHLPNQAALAEVRQRLLAAKLALHDEGQTIRVDDPGHTTVVLTVVA